MLATRFGATFPTIMADDTMEISSDHGFDIGGDDIEIDLDFPAAQVDEDYVLDDAAPNVEDDFHPQSPPAHDDMMTDDFEQSYHVSMDGEDCMQEDSHDMEHESIGISITVADVPTVEMGGDHLEDIPQSIADGEMNDQEATWESNEPELHTVADGEMTEPEATWDTSDNHAEPGQQESEITWETNEADAKVQKQESEVTRETSDAHVEAQQEESEHAWDTSDAHAEPHEQESEVTWETSDTLVESEQHQVGTEAEARVSEITWETNNEPELESNEADTQVESSDEKRHLAAEENRESLQNTIAQADTISVAHEQVQLNSPHDTDRHDAEGGHNPRSPVAINTDQISGSQGHEVEHSDESAGPYSTSEHIVDTNEATSDGVTSSSLPLEVLVMYGGAEYVLFGNSDADDIDSYFLSDISIKDKPLANLFEAIRNVIHEDLSDDDELCLSVPALGLDLEEVGCFVPYPQPTMLTHHGQMSSFTATTTMGQIIDLNDKLLQNDGHSGPLCLSLGTRPKFASRFAYLLSEAADGKGLSAMADVDEISEGLEDVSEHVSDNEREDYSEAANYVLDETTENQERDFDQQGASDNTLAHVAQHLSHDVADDGEDVETVLKSTTDGHDTDATAVRSGPVEDAIQSQKSEPTGGDYDEDDLIDYSDEEAQEMPAAKPKTNDSRASNGTFEDFIPPCYRPSACFCAKCNILMIAEYESINEDLRRRSIARKAENARRGQQAANAEQGGDHFVGGEVNPEKEELQHDGNDEEPSEDKLVATHEEQSTNTGGEDHYIVEDDFFLDDDAADGGDDLNNQTNLANEPGQDELDEFYFGDDLGQLPQESTDLGHEGVDAFVATSANTTLSVDNAHGFADVADSESAASEKTLEAQYVSSEESKPVVREDDVDEIDYDDDDELDMVKVPESVVEESTPVSGSGKRQRDDDDASTRGQGMKLGIVKARLY
jgi:hypothetical protein